MMLCDDCIKLSGKSSATIRKEKMCDNCRQVKYCTQVSINEVMAKLLDRENHQEQSKIADIYSKVITFQKYVQGEPWPRDKDKGTQQFVMWLIREASELLEETNFTLHKPLKELDRERIRDEVSDLFIFNLGLSGLWFEDVDDLLDVIAKKVEKNFKRIKLGRDNVE